MAQARFWDKDKVQDPGWEASPLLGLPLGQVSLTTHFGGSGARQGGPRFPGCRRPRCALPHPCAERIAPRCRGNGNSYTLLFILKDTCSYLLLQSPQKIACHAEFLRGNRTRRSPPTSRLWGRASRRGGREDAVGDSPGPASLDGTQAGG